MKTMKIALIAIGYNRKNDYSRLIESLLIAEYQNDTVDLILSIDNSGSNEVEQYANSVIWPYGEKIVKTYEKRQGLRKHILECGNFLKKYDAVVVFEDDIVASPAFYNYVKQCVIKYADNMEIAGISLYSHMQNVFAKYPFIPSPSKYDVYFQTMAQSWGQIWLKKQWFKFLNWYKENEGVFSINEDLPADLENWGENSWLKYHISYCVKMHKYFVYPYYSLTTCFTSAGEHNIDTSNMYQVQLCIDPSKEYKLPDLDYSDGVYYDIFFEREYLLAGLLGISNNELDVDLYGTKNRVGKKKYLLSCRKYDFEIIKTFGRIMRPHELNIVFLIDGSNYFLYNTTKFEKNENECSHFKEEMFMYYYKLSNRTKDLVKASFYQAKRNIRINIITRLKRK